jgi:zinc protease
MMKFLRLILVPAFALILFACDDIGKTPKDPVETTIDPSVRGEAQSLSGKIKIQRVVSDSGIEAWLVEEHSIPLVALNLGFQGGAYLDPEDKDGLANMLSSLLDEGAGDLDSQAFQAKLYENSISLSFRAGRDALTGGLFTLSENKDLAFELLHKALTQPRFDEEPVERIRSQIAVLQRRSEAAPNARASQRLYGALFEGHPYARNVFGTPESLALLSVQDLDVYRKSFLTKDRLKIAVVGDITPGELEKVLNEVFGDLPAAGTPRDIAPVVVPTPGRMIIDDFANPQSTVMFAGPGLMQDDEDFIPVFVVNYVLGGGGFTSRLHQEVREKRGLTYGIYTYFQALERAGLFGGTVASDNGKVAEAISITKDEIDSLRLDGITEEELIDAKTYLTGAFALRFDSNAKISGQLISYQLQGFPFEYINIRNDLVNAVTMDDVDRVLNRFPAAKDLTFVVVGQPEGLAATD